MVFKQSFIKFRKSFKLHLVRLEPLIKILNFNLKNIINAQIPLRPSRYAYHSMNALKTYVCAPVRGILRSFLYSTLEIIRLESKCKKFSQEITQMRTSTIAFFVRLIKVEMIQLALIRTWQIWSWVLSHKNLVSVTRWSRVVAYTW